MSRWPIFAAYLCGVGALWSVWLGDQILRTLWPDSAIVCWLSALMLMLMCMMFAQMDGNRGRVASPSGDSK